MKWCRSASSDDNVDVYRPDRSSVMTRRAPSNDSPAAVPHVVARLLMQAISAPGMYSNIGSNEPGAPCLHTPSRKSRNSRHLSKIVAGAAGHSDSAASSAAALLPSNDRQTRAPAGLYSSARSTILHHRGSRYRCFWRPCRDCQLAARGDRRKYTRLGGSPQVHTKAPQRRRAA